MFNIKTEFYLKIIFLFSLIALISAFLIEHVLGHQPCNLCLIERIPYGLSIMIIMAIFLTKKNHKFLVLLLILTFTILKPRFSKGPFDFSTMTFPSDGNTLNTLPVLPLSLPDLTLTISPFLIFIFIILF